MKFLPAPKTEHSFAIYGLGYESRSVFSLLDNPLECHAIAIGYTYNCDVHSYPINKKFFIDRGVIIKEGDDDQILNYLEREIQKINMPTDVFLDISVMSRSRLSLIMIMLIKMLPKKSTVTISYSITSYIPAPSESSPIKQIGPVSNELAGAIGGLEKPVSLIIGLGYEKNKALGIYNYFDSNSELVFTLTPKSHEHQFEADVLRNNNILLSSIPKRNHHYYDTADPYNTYLDLKALYLGLRDIARPVFIPLGPKILTAINVVIGLEFSPHLPVWRVSSNHTEEPVDRAARGERIKFSIEL